MSEPVSGARDSVHLSPVDLSEIGRAEPDPAALAKLSARIDALCVESQRRTAARERAERALADAQVAEREVNEQLLPDALAEGRLTKCSTESGFDVVLKNEVKAQLAGKERVSDREAFFRWLVDKGHGGVIKNLVIVELARGEDDRANALVAALRAQGFGEVEARKDVHPGTLSSLVRELLEAGKIVPRDIVNVHERKVCTVKQRQT